jgi:hypothetical protein
MRHGRRHAPRPSASSTDSPKHAIICSAMRIDETRSARRVRFPCRAALQPRPVCVRVRLMALVLATVRPSPHMRSASVFGYTAPDDVDRNQQGAVGRLEFRRYRRWGRS